MNGETTPSTPDPSEPPATPDGVRADSSSREASLRIRGGRWALVPLAGFLAGAGAWLLGEVTCETFQPVVRRVDTMAGPLLVPETASKRRTDTGNAALVYGGLGMLLGMTLGLTGGLLRGSRSAAVWAGLIGALSGAIIPAAMSMVAVPYHIEYLRGLDPTDANLLVPLLFHAAVWGGVGLAGGLALGLGLGGRESLVKAIVGGSVGAILGTGLYEIIAATAVPRGNSASPLSDSGAVRLVACLAVAIGVSAIAAASVGSGRRARPAPAGDEPTP